MIVTTTDFITEAAYSLTGNLPGALAIRGENSYENIEWNVGIVTSIPTAQQVLDKAQELYDNEGMRRLRHHRSRLLTACDWTQGADSPLSDEKKAEWATYRQQLRDLTSTAEPVIAGPYPIISNVVWPTEPS